MEQKEGFFNSKEKNETQIPKREYKPLYAETTKNDV